VPWPILITRIADEVACVVADRIEAGRPAPASGRAAERSSLGERPGHVLRGAFNHSSSFVQRRRPAPLRTAIAIARRWPTMTTRRLPRVTAV